MSVKQQLLETEAQGWLRLCDVFQRIGDEQWGTPTVETWTAKDVMAHIACWHSEATNVLEAHRMGTRRPRQWEDVDAFNVEAYERCKDMTLHDVRAMSAAARHRFREEIAHSPDPISEKLGKFIEDNGAAHYEEHIPALEAVIEGAPA